MQYFVRTVGTKPQVSYKCQSNVSVGTTQHLLHPWLSKWEASKGQALNNKCADEIFQNN